MYIVLVVLIGRFVTCQTNEVKYTALVDKDQISPTKKWHQYSYFATSEIHGGMIMLIFDLTVSSSFSFPDASIRLGYVLPTFEPCNLSCWKSWDQFEGQLEESEDGYITQEDEPKKSKFLNRKL